MLVSFECTHHRTIVSAAGRRSDAPTVTLASGGLPERARFGKYLTKRLLALR